jgi:glycosyltransferase involved in cell wall biosynthesis
VEFLGYRYGAELAEAYRSASVLVFPSLTDTLGLVMYEALACGTPVAAFPVAGPLDVLIEGRTGALDSDLRGFCLRALALDRRDCARWAAEQSWHVSAQQFSPAACPGRAAAMPRRRVARQRLEELSLALQALIHQPFAVGDGGVLGVVQVGRRPFAPAVPGAG